MVAEQILVGRLQMPNIHDMKTVYGLEVYRQIEGMFSALWNVYLVKGHRKLENGSMTNTISLPYWVKRINHPKAMNQALKLLSDHNWITVSTRPNNNWSEAYLNESKLLTYVTKTQLDRVRMYNKFNKYKLEFHNHDQDFGANKMKINGKVHIVNHSCNGFAKAGKVPFQYDTNQIWTNFDTVLREVNKGIENMIEQYPAILDDHANYKAIGKEVLESLMYDNGTYNSGPRTSDPRHRNNAGYLNKIANPVGFKVMRGLLTIPEEHRNICTPNGLRNKYLFIAELVGFKSGSVQSKVHFGRTAYYNRTLTKCDVESIWLERLYVDIDNAFRNKLTTIRQARSTKIQSYKAGTAWHNARIPGMIEDLIKLEESIIRESTYKWQVPIEIDMSASVLGYIGLLLNHKPFLDRCNITPGDLSDAWGHDVITNRDQFKTIMRQCYGSQMTAQAMWNDMEIDYTAEEVMAFNQQMEDGELSVAIAFKDFIINNAQMQPVMELNVLGDKVKTYCNKFHNIGETTSIFDLYDTATNSIRRVHNTETKRVPDLLSFRRYSVTGLIHGLDGRVMNNTVDAVINRYGWCLDVHDADILCCESADYAREVYANGRTEDEPSLKYVHSNRNKILSEYFTSLNIPASRIADWKANVVPLIEPLIGELDINPMVLK
jgi:hypothetical protein